MCDNQSHTLIVGDFNTLFSPLDITDRQKLNREIKELTDIMIQMGLSDIDKTFHPNTKEYTFFSTPHGFLSKNNHMLSNKANLNRYKKLE